MENRFLIIDGNSIACRGAFVQPVLTNSKGRETGGTYRFFTMIDKVMKMVRATHVVVGFDVSKENFRTGIDPNYKANRETRTTDQLYHQFEDIKSILSAIGIKHVGLFGYEADDILGTYAHISKADKNFLLTGDKDSFQLITDNTVVLFPQTGASDIKTYTNEEFEKKYGITVSQFIDMKALMGDDGDNIKGIEKCGEKTAAKWLNKYGTIDSVIENANEITGKIGENLRTWIPNANTNLQLVTIRKDVPVPYSFEDCEINLNWNNAVEIFNELEFYSFVKKVKGGTFYHGKKTI